MQQLKAFLTTDGENFTQEKFACRRHRETTFSTEGEGGAALVAKFSLFLRLAKTVNSVVVIRKSSILPSTIPGFSQYIIHINSPPRPSADFLALASIF